MRSKALSFLLSLSLMFCVGFGSSLTAHATSLPLFSVPFCNVEHLEMRLRFNSNGSWSQYHYSNYESDTYYTNFTDNILYSNLSALDFGINMSTGCFEYPYNFDAFDYYFTFTISSYGTNFSQFSFVPSSFSLGYYTPNLDYVVKYLDFETLSASNYNAKGFTLIGKLPDDFAGSIVHNIVVYGSGNIVLPANVYAFVYQVPKNTLSSDISAIIQAIDNQTSDLQQSIEDQYGGDPGSSFPVDDIITQHNEKMGVLSFSSEALMQVLGLLSPDQTLSSELVFPSMSLTIAGQRNRVQLWPEYRFDLNTLKQHWPDFIGLMQSLTTALVWIFVLRYCYRVFEKYFLAGGGS